MNETILHRLEDAKRKFIRALQDIEIEAISTSDLEMLRQCQVLRMLVSKDQE